MTAAESNFSLSKALSAEADGQHHRSLSIALLGYRSHPHVGGQGIYLNYLSAALCDMGHRVDVFSGPPYPELDARVRLIKVPSLDLFSQPSHVRALRPKHLMSFTDTYEWWTMLTGGFGEPYTFGRRVSRLLINNDYDVIHDNQSLCDGLLDLQARGACVLSTIHHPIHRDRDIALAATPRWRDRLLIKRWYSFLRMQERVVRRLKHVVTVSSASQRDIALCFARPAESTPVISNGIDTATFCPRPSINRIPLRIITTASSDQPLKGLSFLLEAIATLKFEFPDIHLRVIGKLKTDGTTQQKLRSLELDRHVSFISSVSTDTLVDEYARASIAVCPSLYEGFGLPAGEAMACELPLVTTDGGALPEVAGSAALVIPAGSSTAIADRLRFLFDNPDQAKLLGVRARQHIVAHFSWEKVAERLSEYYHAMVNDADN